MGVFITQPESGADTNSDRVHEDRSERSSESSPEGEKGIRYYEKKTAVTAGEILRQYRYEEDMFGRTGDIGGLFGM